MTEEEELGYSFTSSRNMINQLFNPGYKTQSSHKPESFSKQGKLIKHLKSSWQGA